MQMDHIVEREGGWNAAKDWRDALSGGDQQKIAWARLFYHKPKVFMLRFAFDVELLTVHLYSTLSWMKLLRLFLLIWKQR